MNHRPPQSSGNKDDTSSYHSWSNVPAPSSHNFPQDRTANSFKLPSATLLPHQSGAHSHNRLSDGSLSDLATSLVNMQGRNNVRPGQPVPSTPEAFSGSQLDQTMLLRLLQQQPGGFHGHLSQDIGGSALGGQDLSQAEALKMLEASVLQLDPSQASSWRSLQNASTSGLSGGQPAYGSSPGIISGHGGKSNTGGGVPAGSGTAAKPKQRARRGQATDPHSIAERLRRERIAERMKSLQELVPSAAKVDKASMLDDIIEYVRFLQLQVKVLNLSRLNDSASEAVRELLHDLEEQATEKGEQAGSSYSSTEMKHMERQVALLLETDMGSAMQYLQSKGLCLMPIGLTNEGKQQQQPVDIAKQGSKEMDPQDVEVEPLASHGEQAGQPGVKDEPGRVEGVGDGGHSDSLFGGQRGVAIVDEDFVDFS